MRLAFRGERGGAVCTATRQQVARVCVAALGGGPTYSRRVVEVVTRPEATQHGQRERETGRARSSPCGDHTAREARPLDQGTTLRAREESPRRVDAKERLPPAL